MKRSRRKDKTNKSVKPADKTVYKTLNLVAKLNEKAKEVFF